MDVIATLIAADRLSESDIRTACDLLGDAGLPVRDQSWLDAGSACDLFVDAGAAQVRQLLEGRLPSVDVIVQPAGERARRLLVADMDSTMITVECIDELADFAGLKAEVAAITERAMEGELDFEAALTARVALLEGLEAQAIDRCREERVRLTPGARTLVRTMKARGATTILVSGGFTRFAEPVAAEIGFDRVVANRLEVAGGRLTGKASPPIVGAQTKRDTLVTAARDLAIPLEHTLAVGDGANDIPMLMIAGLGIAYRAKPAAREAADAVVDHGDLTALLYAQGIPKAGWVSA